MSYEIQDNYDIIGTKASPVTLSGSYAAARSASFQTANAEQVILNVHYTMGTAETGNSIQIKVETSPDGIDFNQIVTEEISSGVRTLSKGEFTFTATGAAATYDHISIAVPSGDKFMKVWVKETGIAANGGSCYVDVTVSGR